MFYIVSRGTKAKGADTECLLPPLGCGCERERYGKLEDVNIMPMCVLL